MGVACVICFVTILNCVNKVFAASDEEFKAVLDRLTTVEGQLATVLARGKYTLCCEFIVLMIRPCHGGRSTKLPCLDSLYNTRLSWFPVQHPRVLVPCTTPACVGSLYNTRVS